MDIGTQTQIVLRNRGYTTWTIDTASRILICFENSVLIGFVHTFESAAALLAQWKAEQEAILTLYATAFRYARDKAWNVYSVFLTDDDQAPPLQREIERLEENFAMTRKIARGGIRSADDVERVLLPLTSIQYQPSLAADDFQERLRVRLKELPEHVVTAFLANATATDVAHILTDTYDN